MKKKLIIAISFVVVFALGCVLGAVVQHLKTGYHHKILRSESFPFPDGEVTLSYTAESIGMPFLHPETSVLTVRTKHWTPITVYKARRTFQESCPHVRDVRTEGNQISWQDGINTYHLTVDPVEGEAEQSPAGDVLKAAPEE